MLYGFNSEAANTIFLKKPNFFFLFEKSYYFICNLWQICSNLVMKKNSNSESGILRNRASGKETLEDARGERKRFALHFINMVENNTRWADVSAEAHSVGVLDAVTNEYHFTYNTSQPWEYCQRNRLLEET